MQILQLNFGIPKCHKTHMFVNFQIQQLGITSN